MSMKAIRPYRGIHGSVGLNWYHSDRERGCTDGIME